MRAVSIVVDNVTYQLSPNGAAALAGAVAQECVALHAEVRLWKSCGRKKEAHAYGATLRQFRNIRDDLQGKWEEETCE